MKGLQLRIGKRRHTWEFYSERRDHGERRYSCKALGHYDRGFRAGYVSGGRGPSMAGEVYIGPQPALQRLPDHVDVETARNKARAWAVKAIEGTLPVGKREGVKFADAFADYVDYLERKAASKGKAPRWAKNVRQLGAQLLLPSGHVEPYRNERAPGRRCGLAPRRREAGRADFGKPSRPHHPCFLQAPRQA